MDTNRAACVAMLVSFPYVVDGGVGDWPGYGRRGNKLMNEILVETKTVETGTVKSSNGQIGFFYGNQYKSKLIIGDLMVVMSRNTMPSRWRRFWYRILLGWEWEKVTAVGAGDG